MRTSTGTRTETWGSLFGAYQSRSLRVGIKSGGGACQQAPNRIPSNARYVGQPLRKCGETSNSMEERARATNSWRRRIARSCRRPWHWAVRQGRRRGLLEWLVRGRELPQLQGAGAAYFLERFPLHRSDVVVRFLHWPAPEGELDVDGNPDWMRTSTIHSSRLVPPLGHICLFAAVTAHPTSILAPIGLVELGPAWRGRRSGSWAWWPLLEG